MAKKRSAASTGGSPPPAPVSAAADPELAGRLMRRQAGLSTRVATVFLVLVVGLPLLTHFAPQWTQQPFLGFPISWFLLGILFYPITWALSAYFVQASEEMEAQDAASIREQSGP